MFAAGAPAPDMVLDPAAGRGPDWLDAVMRARLPMLVELRRRIHAHPELSRQEHSTTELVADALASIGVTAQPLPCGTGLIADIGPATGLDNGRTIALRADLDALPLTEESGLPFASTVPGVAHACGHDVHTTVLVGAAFALAAAPALPGRVRLIFQPAEEVMPGGAGDVVASGALEAVDRAYALHCDPGVPVGRIGLRTGAITSACDMVELTVTGPGGHTSRPQRTVDVVGALAAVTGQLPYLLARHLPAQAGVTMVWGSVHAGDAANVIPQHGIAKGTVRIADRAAWADAEALVRRLVGEVLAPFGADHRLAYRRDVPPVVNDSAAVVALRSAVAGGIGPEAAVDVEQSSGAEDFAVILEQVPGALARLGVWDGVSEPVDLHSPGFHADERAIAVGVRTLVHAVLESWPPA